MRRWRCLQRSAEQVCGFTCQGAHNSCSLSAQLTMTLLLTVKLQSCVCGPPAAAVHAQHHCAFLLKKGVRELHEIKTSNICQCRNNKITLRHHRGGCGCAVPTNYNIQQGNDTKFNMGMDSLVLQRGRGGGDRCILARISSHRRSQYLPTHCQARVTTGVCTLACIALR